MHHTFAPKIALIYGAAVLICPCSVFLRLNNDSLSLPSGSPWTVEVMEGSGTRVAVLGDTIKHFPAGQLSAFDISAANVSKEDIQVHIVSKSRMSRLLVVIISHIEVGNSGTTIGVSCLRQPLYV